MLQVIDSVLLGLLILTSLSAVTVRAQQNHSAAEKVIAALENQWLKSQQTNNPDPALPLLASRFRYTSEIGKLMDRRRYLADAKATNTPR